VNCSLVDGLIDDYIDSELSPRERSQFEAHLASCQRCLGELRRRSALDRSLRQALGAAVQHRYLSPATSSRSVQLAQQQLGRSIWLHRMGSLGQAAAGLVIAILVLVGVFAALDRLSLPTGLNPITLLPVKHLVSSGRQIVEVSPDAQWDPEGLQPPVPAPGTKPGLALSSSGSFVDPQPMVPGEPFTITLLLHNNLPKTLKSVQFDLEVSGPTGYFQFPLSVSGPLPARGISLVRVTTSSLADTCQDKYMLAPTSIFRLPGTYKLRITVFSPGTEAGK